LYRWGEGTVRRLMVSALLMGFSLGGFLGSIIAGKTVFSALADLDLPCNLLGGHYHDLVSMTAKLSNDKIPGSAPVSGKDKVRRLTKIDWWMFASTFASSIASSGRKNLRIGYYVYDIIRATNDSSKIRSSILGRFMQDCVILRILPGSK